MLTIKQAQMNYFKAPFHQRFIDKMVAHLRKHFTERIGSLSDEALTANILQAENQAQSFDLLSQRDHCLFFSLCAYYGWDFLAQPAHQWMLDGYLLDKTIDSPSMRIQFLAERCLMLEEKRECNIRQTYGQ